MDETYEQLAERNAVFEAEKAALSEENAALSAHVSVLESIINSSNLTDRTEVMSALNSAPETSLARLKAQWQAEAMERLYQKCGHQSCDARPWASSCLEEINELCRQTEEASHG